MSFKKNIFLVAVLITFMMCISTVTASDNVTKDINANDLEVNDLPIDDKIYVDGSISYNPSSNGSFNNPYSSLGQAVYNAVNNSSIVLMDGIYSGEDNSGITINKNLTISSYSNNVTFDGLGNSIFFNIAPNNCLKLVGLKFVNGYTDAYSSQYGVIYNRGTLILNETSFEDITTFMGAIFNEGDLKIYYSTFNKLAASHFAQAILNLGNCTIRNSNIYSSSTNNDYSRIGTTICTLSDISIFNSTVDQLLGDNTYDPDLFKKADIIIENSNLKTFSTMNGTVVIRNSSFDSKQTYGYISFSNCNVTIDRSYFVQSCSASFCNFTAVSSYFGSGLNFNNQNDVNVTYSAILGNVYSNYATKLNVSYNWWGLNNGPRVSYGKYSAVAWIVMTFTCDENPISVGTNTDFIASLTHYTDGKGGMFNLKDPSLLPVRPVRFESQNGAFQYTATTLINGTFSNKLLNNNESSVVYAIIDSQRLRLVVGTGLTDYEWYVSNNTGHDGFGDGSFEYPFKTISHTISKALNGNTIYLFNGTYTNNWNSELPIVKNLTIVGLGKVIISRENARTIFQIKEWGNLKIININFTVNMREYSNYLFSLSGGNLTIENCNFSHINSQGIIYSTSGIQSAGFITVNNVSFYDIVGPAIRGNAKAIISNSSFKKISGIYWQRGYEQYNACIAIFNDIEIYNSIFMDNLVGAVQMFPITYSSNSLRISLDDYLDNGYTSYAIIDNCTFIDNYFNAKGDYYRSNGIGLSISRTPDYGNGIYGLINNCTFRNNQGSLISSTYLNNTLITNNHGAVGSSIVNNSYFYKNSILSSSYGEGYSGTGVLSADTVINSTFIGNSAAYGGAIANPKEVHYCVFINNSAVYKGNDIYSYRGNVNCSSNWWGDNQKPSEDKIFLFMDDLILENWIIMTLERVDHNTIVASLNSLVDNNRNITPLNYSIPFRPVYFTSDFGVLDPSISELRDNHCYSKLIMNSTSADFNVYARIDNQVLDLTIHNNNTQLVMDNVVFYGKDNQYNITLINVNGHRIFNQTLIVEIINPDGVKESFNLLTDEKGSASFNVDYPIGLYTVNVYYGGNGYFEPCNNTAYINILTSLTYVNSFNYTFYGKNNNFYAVLTDVSGRGIANKTIRFTIIDSKGVSKSVDVMTGYQGRADILLSFDVGKYVVRCEFLGDDWYAASSSTSYLTILPVNSTIEVPDVILYGIGNVYNITLKDSHGTLIRGENIRVILSGSDGQDEYILTTDDNGVAKLTINYLPGVYNVHAYYAGDNIYGQASGSGIITVNKVFTTITGFARVVIPVNGIYTAVLTDMFGKRIANGTVTLNIYKGNLIRSLTGVTDGNGEVTFVIDLEEGTYLATLDYDGNIWYCDSTNAATIVVSHDAVLGAVRVNATDFVQYYGEDKYFAISFFDPNTFTLYGKTIVATISSGTWSETYELMTDIFGFARLQIKLNPGIYNITYKYTNAYYGLFAQNSSKISVYRMPTTLLASDVIMNVGEAKYYEIRLLNVNNEPIRNMQVSVDINGTKYNCTTNNDGFVRLLLSLKPGEYLVTYTVDHPNYVYASGSSKIFVVDSNKTSTDLDGTDVVGLDNETLNFTVILKNIVGVPIGAADILVNVTTFNGKLIGTYSGITNSKGEAVFKFNLDYGNYMISAYYAGTTTYLESFAINYMNVKASDNLTTAVLFKSIDDDGYFVVLADVNGTLLSNRELFIKIGDYNSTVVTDKNGKAYVDFDLAPGLHECEVIFAGDDQYRKAVCSFTIPVSGNLTYLFALDLVKYYRNGTQFNAQLLDAEGNCLVNKVVQVTINNCTYNRTTDENGWITLNINLLPGKYDVYCSYISDVLEECAFDTAVIEVLPTVVADDIVKFYRNGTQFFVKVIDGAGNPIVNKTVGMNINGVFYYKNTNSEGVARLNINLAPGEYIITVSNPYDNLLASFNVVVLPIMFGEDLAMYYRNGSAYQVRVLDDNGNPLVNSTVRFNINGVFYNKLTDENGVASLNINLSPNEYVITAEAENGFKCSNKITVWSVLEGNDLTMNYRDGSMFNARLVDGKGRAVVNATVKFNINGVFYNKLTDANGIARLNINLMPGKYIITSMYDKAVTSNTIVINSQA